MRVAAAILVVVACTVAPSRTRADGHLDPAPAAVDRLRTARSVAVIAPDVPMYEMVGFSRIPVRRVEQDAAARDALAAAIAAELTRRGVQVREGPLPTGLAGEVREVLALFRSCAWVVAAGRDAPGWPALEPRSPTAPAAPGVGSLRAIADALEVDAVVLVTGRGVNRTFGYALAVSLTRRRLEGHDRLALAVVGPGGDPDWVAWYWSGRGDLRDPSAAERAARALLGDYPAGENLPPDLPPEGAP
jgi:hypothetical protein